MLTCDHYHLPTSLGEALDLWTHAAAGSRIVAGATDTLPWAREGRAGDVHVPEIVDVSRVEDLAGYDAAEGRVRLGANVTFQQLLTDPALRAHLPCMPYCAIWFADDQIREQATLAGNIVNASPAADGTPPVFAMNGEVLIARHDGGGIVTRRLPIADFVTGPGRTALGRGEIVTAVECDDMAGYGGSFEKVGLRRSLVISVVCATGLVRASADGRSFADARLALGGTGPVPLRLAEVEQFLKGKPITRETIAEASQIPADCIRSRTRREYRREVVRGFVERAIEDACADAGVTIFPASPKEIANV